MKEIAEIYSQVIDGVYRNARYRAYDRVWCGIRSQIDDEVWSGVYLPIKSPSQVLI